MPRPIKKTAARQKNTVTKNFLMSEKPEMYHNFSNKKASSPETARKTDHK